MVKNSPTYLNPQFQRNKQTLLNGKWDLKITSNENIIYQGKVNVPFALETKESQVEHTLKENELAEYTLELPNLDVAENESVIIHFLAVDQVAEVFINDIKIGIHEGGYLPFEFDIGQHLNKDKNILKVLVTDTTSQSIYSYGKQKEKRGGIWYTPSSGIVQDVYLEIVPKERVTGIKVTPLFDEKSVEITVSTNGQEDSAKLIIEGKDVSIKTGIPFIYHVAEFNPWTPDTPYLYEFEVQYKEDKVKSYFGLRKISVNKLGNYSRVMLNNKPIFMSGVLDQGYYSVGYTASDLDEYEKDIKLLKDMGFNTVRKHIKFEHPYFYYLCDKYGLMVIQDFINGGEEYKFRVITVPALFPLKYNDHKYKSFGRNSIEGRNFYINESTEIIQRLYNHPSVVVYTVFNEGWGQFDSVEMTNKFKSIDSTRLYDSTSGWHDHGAGDFKSLHVYFKKFRVKKDKRALLLSEFGGYGLKIVNHTFSSAYFCYKKTKDEKELTNLFVKLYEKEIIPAVSKGLCGTIYTQLADVEDELNGLVTFDRACIKIKENILKDINERLYKEMEK